MGNSFASTEEGRPERSWCGRGGSPEVSWTKWDCDRSYRYGYRSYGSKRAGRARSSKPCESGSDRPRGSRHPGERLPSRSESGSSTAPRSCVLATVPRTSAANHVCRNNREHGGASMSAHLGIAVAVALLPAIARAQTAAQDPARAATKADQPHATETSISNGNAASNG